MGLHCYLISIILLESCTLKPHRQLGQVNSAISGLYYVLNALRWLVNLLLAILLDSNVMWPEDLETGILSSVKNGPQTLNDMNASASNETTERGRNRTCLIWFMLTVTICHHVKLRQSVDLVSLLPLWSDLYKLPLYFFPNYYNINCYVLSVIFKQH